MKKPRDLDSALIMGLLRENEKVLKKYKVKRIGLFGSYVRGEQDKKSDIDLMVKLEKPSFDNFMDLAFYLEDLFGKKVDLVTEGSLSPHIEPYVKKEVLWHET
jgi:predicted nucleotidyltransferase